MSCYRTLQPVYRHADYLSAVKCVFNRRLVSRFRTGCDGLQVDTYWWAKDVDMSRGCFICKWLGFVKDEQRFVFNCPVYSHIGTKHVSLFQHCCTAADCMSFCEPDACGGPLLHVGNLMLGIFCM